MQRRKFLKLIGAGSLLAGVGVVSINSFNSSIKGMLLNDTEGMNIQEAYIDRFLSDADREHFWNQFDFTKKGFIVAHTWLGEGWVGSKFLPYRLKYNQYRSKIVATFLLSTDFFTNKMQPGLPIHYTGFYNPYKNACASPFSNYYYPPA